MAAPVGLGTAGNFSVLAGSTVTNTGPTTMSAQLGLDPGSAVTVRLWLPPRTSTTVPRDRPRATS